MLLSRHKLIRLIGFSESTITQEAQFYMSKEFDGVIEIITPDDFLTMADHTGATYGVAFTLDREQRSQCINLIEGKGLDCLIYIHDTVVCYFDKTEENIRKHIGHGSFISPFSTILLGATIGKHSIVETYCLISHYVTLGQDSMLHSGTMIAGKTTVGDHCVFNFKSNVLNALSICDYVEVGGVSTITKNITESGYYVGSPARRLGDYKMTLV